MFMVKFDHDFRPPKPHNLLDFLDGVSCGGKRPLPNPLDFGDAGLFGDVHRQWGDGFPPHDDLDLGAASETRVGHLSSRKESCLAPQFLQGRERRRATGNSRFSCSFLVGGCGAVTSEPASAPPLPLPAPTSSLGPDQRHHRRRQRRTSVRAREGSSHIFEVGRTHKRWLSFSGGFSSSAAAGAPP